jgi:hypothetical protein
LEGNQGSDLSRLGRGAKSLRRTEPDEAQQGATKGRDDYFVLQGARLRLKYLQTIMLEDFGKSVRLS